MNNSILKKEDYEEPSCLLNMKPHVTAVPIGRILEKLDDYCSRNDYVSAERHLDYWLSEARQGCDERGELTVLNEQIGLFRKTEQREKCIEAVGKALELSERIEGNSASRGTTLVNAATGCKACGMDERALQLYNEARSVYELRLEADDARLGALYNNMAVTLAGLGNFTEARALYEKAMSIMSVQPRGNLEVAVTCLNLADLVNAESGPEAGETEINAFLDRAEKLLENETVMDGYYAFICEKCAPSFGYYGYFLTEKKLRKAAKEIYERT